MLLTRNIKVGNHRKILRIIIIFFFILTPNNVKSDDNLVGQNTDVKILDKISSKNELIKLANGEEFIYKDLAIKSMKCKNSEFDDNPETTAYIQVRDLNNKNNDEVFVFNGWTFASSPTVRPFDHPVYDIWLTKCY